jgi:hypothetical protein
VPPAKRVTIEARFTDIPLLFDDKSKQVRLIVARAETFDVIRKKFNADSPNLVAFSVGGDPLPIRQLAGSLAPQTVVKVERLKRDTLSIERNNFPVYITVGEVRKKLRTGNPKRRLQISDARGVLPNCAVLIRNPEVTQLPEPELFSLRLTGDYEELDPEQLWDADHTAKDLISCVAMRARVRSDRIQLFVWRFELQPDDLLCELGTNEIEVVFREPRTAPNSVSVRYANGSVKKRECFDPSRLHVGELGDGLIAIDWRLFPPEKTLAEVGWSPRSVVCALPPVNGPPPREALPKWTVRNVDIPDELVEVTGPTVRQAIEQILEKRTRPGKGEILLRMVGGQRLQNLAADLPSGETLEFISVVDAKQRLCREAGRIVEEYPDLDDWIALVESNGWDVQVSLDQVLSRRRMLGPPWTS